MTRADNTAARLGRVASATFKRAPSSTCAVGPGDRASVMVARLAAAPRSAERRASQTIDPKPWSRRRPGWRPHNEKPAPNDARQHRWRVPDIRVR